MRGFPLLGGSASDGPHCLAVSRILQCSVRGQALRWRRKATSWTRAQKALWRRSHRHDEKLALPVGCVRLWVLRYPSGTEAPAKTATGLDCWVVSPLGTTTFQVKMTWPARLPLTGVGARDLRPKGRGPSSVRSWMCSSHSARAQSNDRCRRERSSDHQNWMSAASVDSHWALPNPRPPLAGSAA